MKKHLEQSPQVFGLNRVRWGGPTLVVHLKRQFGIKLKVRQVQNWMHQLGYRLKRAGYTYLKSKGEEASRFYQYAAGENLFDQGEAYKLVTEKKREDLLGEDLADSLVMEVGYIIKSPIY